MPAKMEEILAISERYDIPILEDAAEAFGSQYKGKQAGSFGRMAILSFNGNKILNTSGGGMLLSDDKAMTDKARFLSTQAREQAPWYQHSQLGYNYRMSNIIAGIGRGQMEVIEERIRQRRNNHMFYRNHLDGLKGSPCCLNPMRITSPTIG
jgi:dTDP-4-amino-4,6-dideoxygalactose transaminase